MRALYFSQRRKRQEKIIRRKGPGKIIRTIRKVAALKYSVACSSRENTSILFHGFACDTRGILRCVRCIFLSAGRGGEKIIRTIRKVAAWNVERFSTDCRGKKMNTTVLITPTHHNRSKQRYEPFKILGNYL